MSQFTKSGYSKNFGCCGYWKTCNLGKDFENCHYIERDPETMNGCAAYRRNKKLETELQALDKAFAMFDVLCEEARKAI